MRHRSLNLALGEAWIERIQLITVWVESDVQAATWPMDLVQEVLVLLMRKMPEFVYDPKKS